MANSSLIGCSAQGFNIPNKGSFSLIVGERKENKSNWCTLENKMFCSPFSKCAQPPPPPPPPGTSAKFQYKSGSFQGDEFEDRDEKSAPQNKSTMRIQEPSRTASSASEASVTKDELRSSGIKVDVSDYEDL